MWSDKTKQNMVLKLNALFYMGRIQTLLEQTFNNIFSFLNISIAVNEIIQMLIRWKEHVEHFAPLNSQSN